MSAVYTPPEVAGNAVDGIYIPGPSDLEEENVARTDWERNPWRRVDRKSTRLNSSHVRTSRMPSSA